MPSTLCDRRRLRPPHRLRLRLPAATPRRDAASRRCCSAPPVRPSKAASTGAICCSPACGCRCGLAAAGIYALAALTTGRPLLVLWYAIGVARRLPASCAAPPGCCSALLRLVPAAAQRGAAQCAQVHPPPRRAGPGGHPVARPRPGAAAAHRADRRQPPPPARPRVDPRRPELRLHGPVRGRGRGAQTFAGDQSADRDFSLAADGPRRHRGDQRRAGRRTDRAPPIRIRLRARGRNPAHRLATRLPEQSTVTAGRAGGRPTMPARRGVSVFERLARAARPQARRQLTLPHLRRGGDREDRQLPRLSPGAPAASTSASCCRPTPSRISRSAISAC